MKKIMVLLIAFSLIHASAAFAESFTGKVIGIRDGNTISVSCNEKVKLVRLANVDCPDLNQDFGQQAREYLTGLIFGKEVWVDVKSVDHSNRGVSKMTLNGQDVGVLLVQAGFGWHDSKFGSNARILEAQTQAQAGRAGLWSQDNPVPPWEFRVISRGIIPNFNAKVDLPPATGTQGYGFVPLRDQTCNSAFGIHVLTPSWGGYRRWRSF
jgi:micrococcal nuclease